MNNNNNNINSSNSLNEIPLNVSWIKLNEKGLLKILVSY